MGRDEALELLPPTYRDALIMRDSGQSVLQIATQLGIDVTAIDALLAIGDDKLAALLA